MTNRKEYPEECLEEYLKEEPTEKRMEEEIPVEQPPGFSQPAPAKVDETERAILMTHRLSLENVQLRLENLKLQEQTLRGLQQTAIAEYNKFIHELSTKYEFSPNSFGVDVDTGLVVPRMGNPSVL